MTGKPCPTDCKTTYTTPATTPTCTASTECGTNKQGRPQFCGVPPGFDGSTDGRQATCLDCVMCYGITNIDPVGGDCKTWCDPRTVTQEPVTVTGEVGFTCAANCDSGSTSDSVHESCKKDYYCSGRPGQSGICVDCVACEVNLPSCGVDCAMHCGMNTTTSTTTATVFVPDEPGEAGEFCDPTAPFDTACMECVEGLKCYRYNSNPKSGICETPTTTPVTTTTTTGEGCPDPDKEFMCTNGTFTPVRIILLSSSSSSSSSSSL